MTATHTPITLHPESSSMPVPRWTPTSTLRELAILITSERREALAAWKALRESLGSAAIEDAALMTRDEFGKTICVEPLLDITDATNAGVHERGFWEVFFHAVLQAPSSSVSADTGVHRASSLVLSQLHTAGIQEDDVANLRRNMGPGDTLLACLATASPDLFNLAGASGNHHQVRFAFPENFEQVVRGALFRRRRTIRRPSPDDGLGH